MQTDHFSLSTHLKEASVQLTVKPTQGAHIRLSFQHELNMKETTQRMPSVSLHAADLIYERTVCCDINHLQEMKTW